VAQGVGPKFKPQYCKKKKKERKRKERKCFLREIILFSLITYLVVLLQLPVSLN
jgi:hypothetical protein